MNITGDKLLYFKRIIITVQSQPPKCYAFLEVWRIRQIDFRIRVFARAEHGFHFIRKSARL